MMASSSPQVLKMGESQIYVCVCVAAALQMLHFSLSNILYVALTLKNRENISTSQSVSHQRLVSVKAHPSFAFYQIIMQRHSGIKRSLFM